MSATATTRQDNIVDRTDSGYYESPVATKATGWPEDSNTWTHLLASTHSNPTNYFSLQMSGGFFDNDHFFVRKTAGNGDRPWHELLHTGNIGKREINVIDFGAKLDGTDDTAAYTAARAAAGRNGTVQVPKGQFVVGVLGGSQEPILWQLQGNSYGASNVPVNGIGTDTVETFLDGAKFFTRTGTRPNSGPVVRIDSNVTHNTGTLGKGVHSSFQVNTIANTPAGDFVWSINNIFTCRIPGGASNGLLANNQSVGHANASFRPADALNDGLGARGPLWGHLSQCADYTGQPSNVSGALINQEWNLAASGDDPGNDRLMHHMTITRPGDVNNQNLIGAAGRVGYVSLITGESGPVGTGSYIGSGYTVRIGWDRAAFDASEGVGINTAPAFKRAAGQYSSWEASNTFRDVYLDGAFRWFAAGQQVLAVNGGGELHTNRLRLTGMPASPAGLPNGSVWVDLAGGNVLRIV